jgi:rhombotail lipoprotein
MKIVSRSILGILVAALITSCGWWGLESEEEGQRHGVSSSLVDFLYPNGEVPPEYGEVTPELALPIRVGIAFVPPGTWGRGVLDEAREQEMLETVKQRFEQREYISSIEVIPEQYMRAGKGFQTVDQIARLYRLDVLALVSYDQASFTGDTKASVWYWTIVGAYLIKGSRNDVNTFLDIAVFDVATHQMLMRAPGTSEVSGKATMVEAGSELRKSKEKGFELAMADMTDNLEVVLDGFEARIEAEEDVGVTIAHRPGYEGGGGSHDPALLAMLALLLGLNRFRGRD